MKKHACRNDLLLTTEDHCPICNESNFSMDWKGKIIIINKDESDVAKHRNHPRNGEYAIKVR